MKKRQCKGLIKASKILDQAPKQSFLGKVCEAALRVKSMDVGRYRIVAQESCEETPLGIIVDVIDPKDNEVVDTMTVWYDNE